MFIAFAWFGEWQDDTSRQLVLIYVNVYLCFEYVVVVGRNNIFRQRRIVLGELTHSLLLSNLESINIVVPFESVDETLVCGHSNESYWVVLSGGDVCFWQFLQNEIQDFSLNFELSTLGSERVLKKWYSICLYHGNIFL